MVVENRYLLISPQIPKEISWLEPQTSAIISEFALTFRPLDSFIDNKQTEVANFKLIANAAVKLIMSNVLTQ